MTEKTVDIQPQTRGARIRLGADLVGRAFRCRDGVVRWVVGQTPSTRNLHLRWFAEDSEVWHHGGSVHPKSWLADERGGPDAEVPTPRPGETYVYIGLTATRTTFRRASEGSPDTHDMRVPEVVGG